MNYMVIIYHDDIQLKKLSEVQLTLRASVVREGQVRFTAEALRFFGESHARTQCRRLLLQVQAEARAVKEEWALDDLECLKRVPGPREKDFMKNHDEMR